MRGTVNETFRLALLDRDDHTCQYCGVVITGDYCIDHVLPCVLGGNSLLHNMVVACVGCNLSKHTTVWVPNNLDVICAQRPEHAALVRQLAASDVPIPNDPRLIHSVTRRTNARQRMLELWADPTWAAIQRARQAADKERHMAQWERTYGRPFNRKRAHLFDQPRPGEQPLQPL